MNFIVLFCIICSFICAVLICNSDAAVSAWTEPAIAGASGSGSYTVNEIDVVGNVVATLSCTVDGTASYAITTPSPKVALVSSTGVLTTSSIFDYDIDHPYEFTVTCTDDSDSAVGTASITISVNDQPVFTTTQFVGTIPDGSTAGATATVTVSVTDQNTADTKTYAIVTGDSNGHWMFDANKLKVASGVTLDRATLGGYTLEVMANDGLQGSNNMATVWIAVTTCSGIKAVVAGGLAMIFTVALSILL